MNLSLTGLSELITLKPLKGGRTQLTIIAIGLLNFLVHIGVLNLSPDDVKKITEFLTWAGIYFFAEKVTK